QLERVTAEGNAVGDGCFLGVPVRGMDGIIGALGVEKRNEGPFDDETEELLHNVANQAALAVEAERMRENEEHTYLEIITALAFTVEAKDPYTRGHSQRVSEIAVSIAREMELEEDRVDVVRDAALLHDIGKIGVPDGTLGNPGELSESGWEIMRDHPIMGEYIVKPVEGLQRLRGPIRHHHERVDGSGYPDRLEGSDICLEARIMGVADTLDAMLSDRPYRDALDIETARREIVDNSGTQFDPDVAEVAIRLIDEDRLPLNGDNPPQTPQEVAEFRDVEGT
ncbi:MAG: HD domain-containing phosphohydrolase, partial [Planctomycetota bacterium]